MASYSIVDGPLYRRDGSVTRGRSGVVSSPDEMSEFVSDYRYRKHDIPCLVLETDLAIQFALEANIRLQREDKATREMTQKFLNIAVSTMFGDAENILKDTGSVYYNLVMELLAKEQHPVFSKMAGHLIEELDGRRLLIYLNKNSRGGAYGAAPGEHWHTISRIIRGQRPV